MMLRPLRTIFGVSVIPLRPLQTIFRVNLLPLKWLKVQRKVSWTDFKPALIRLSSKDMLLMVLLRQKRMSSQRSDGVPIQYQKVATGTLILKLVILTVPILTLHPKDGSVLGLQETQPTRYGYRIASWEWEVMVALCYG